MRAFLAAAAVAAAAFATPAGAACTPANGCWVFGPVCDSNQNVIDCADWGEVWGCKSFNSLGFELCVPDPLERPTP